MTTPNAPLPSAISPAVATTSAPAAEAAPTAGRPAVITEARAGRTGAEWVAMGVAVAGLAGAAYVHFKISGQYGAGQSGVTQGKVFIVQGIGLVLAALGLGRGRVLEWLAAVGLAAGSLAAVVASRYVTLPALGPIPAFYEPSWTPDARLAAIFEGIALLGALAGLVLGIKRWKVAKTRSELL